MKGIKSFCLSFDTSCTQTSVTKYLRTGVKDAWWMEWVGRSYYCHNKKGGYCWLTVQLSPFWRQQRGNCTCMFFSHTLSYELCSSLWGKLYYPPCGVRMPLCCNMIQWLNWQTQQHAILGLVYPRNVVNIPAYRWHCLLLYVSSTPSKRGSSDDLLRSVRALKVFLI